ncbi:MAG: choice-of-anchor M domain-containing protein [Bifidobacteriaceae bacterium]|jgi:surface-anchored protein|nr:choice-of-anchor M domain-containing protein [Bifidobacteriaceae bacterium]
MTTHSPPRRGAALIAVLAAAAAAASLAPLAAIGAEGPAPAPKDFRVIGGVHADAVSTFLDQGQLALGSKADVAEGNGTRFEAGDIWFHLEDASKTTVPTPVPAGYEFLGAGGSTVWMAPEGNPNTPGRLWPGFNTESVPLGAIDGDKTTLRLASFEGPGKLEVYTGGGMSPISRKWSSSDAAIRSFEVGRTHMHANWAFSAAGTYKLGVEAQVAIGGQVQAARATYTFVVGDLPAATATTTTLTASSAELALGSPVTLTAQVTPTSAEGWVEFRDGAAVLGHQPLDDGVATLETAALPLGARQLTTVFVPKVANLAAASTSTPLTVTVTETSGGEEFGLYGETAYQAGQSLELRVGGVTLNQGQSLRWVYLAPGSDSYERFTEVNAPTPLSFRRELSTVYDGVQIAAQIVTGTSVNAQTEPITLRVTGPNVGSGVPITLTGFGDEYYAGDVVPINAAHRPLQDGESYRWVYRYKLWQDSWSHDSPDFHRPQGSGPDFVMSSGYMDGNERALQIIDADGQIVGQSAPITWKVLLHDVIINGAQSVYRVGQTVSVSTEVLPQRGNLYYRWLIVAGTQRTTLEETGPNLSFEATAEMGSFRLIGYAYDDRMDAIAGFGEVRISVVDVPEGTQTLSLAALDGHYHQGFAIHLSLIPDPELADNDVVAWEWKWPGGDEWIPIPGAAGLSHDLVAEQALNEVQIRGVATLAGVDEPLYSTIGTVLVDDHGAAANQQVGVGGDKVQDGTASFKAGEAASLTASLSAATVLDSFQWFVKLPGAAAATRIEGATAATYDFTASPDLDGAEISVAVVKPTGAVAYGPSAPVTLAVEAAEPVTTTVTVSGLAASYKVGDTLTLTASQDPDTGEDHWHWFVKPAGSDVYTVVAGQTSSTLTREVVAEDDGASVIARLYGHDHAVIAESAPVVVKVVEGGALPVPGKPGEAPGKRTEADLGDTPEGGIDLGSATVAPGDFLKVGLGGDHATAWVAAWLFSTPTLLGGDWTQSDTAGSITVQIPDDTTLGAHRLAVFGADGSLIGWAKLTVAKADSGKGGGPGGPGDPGGPGGPGGRLAITGAASSTAAALALALALAGAALVWARRRRHTM